MSPTDLAARWRAEADLLRRRGLEEAARMAESFAAEFETWWREHELEALTLKQGATESGYTYSALEKMIRSGRVPNAGTKGTPRVRRRDLPRKALTTDARELAVRLRTT